MFNFKAAFLSAIAIGVIAMVSREHSAFQQLLILNWQDLIAMVLAMLLSLLCQSELVRATITLMGPLPPRRVAFQLNAYSQFAGYIPGNVGTLFCAHFLKSRLSVNYSVFGAAWLLKSIVIVFASSCYALVVLFILNTDFSSSATLAYLFASLAGVCFIIVAILALTKKFDRIPSSLRTLFDTIRTTASQRRCLNRVIFWSFLAIAALGLRIYAAGSALPEPERLRLSLLLPPLLLLSSFINVTPAGLGFREILAGSAGILIGLPMATGLGIALLDRIAQIFCLVAVVTSTWFAPGGYGSISSWVAQTRAQKEKGHSTCSIV